MIFSKHLQKSFQQNIDELQVQNLARHNNAHIMI